MVEVDRDNKECEVCCLRQTKVPFKFRFPDAEDRCNIDYSQIVKILPNPTSSRRGFIEFSCDLKKMGVAFQ